MKRDFEAEITDEHAQWIVSCTYDAAKCSLVINLSSTLDVLKSERTIEFSGVDKLKYRWSQRNRTDVEGLLGGHESEEHGCYRYLLVTDQREIQLTTHLPAVVRAA